MRLYYGSAGLCRYFGAAVFIVTRLYPLNKQRKRLLIHYSRNMAKTELYNVQQEKEEMVRRRESERKRDLK